MTAPASIDEYIAAAPAAVRPILREIRRTVHAAAPDAEEVVSYRMPAFRMHGILLYFAAFQHHIGLFPPVSGDVRLERAIAPYAGPKGNLKFPLDRPIPYALIGRIVRLRVKQDRAGTEARGKQKTATTKARATKFRATKFRGPGGADSGAATRRKARTRRR